MKLFKMKLECENEIVSNVESNDINVIKAIVKSSPLIVYCYIENGIDPYCYFSFEIDFESNEVDLDGNRVAVKNAIEADNLIKEFILSWVSRYMKEGIKE